VLTYIDDLDVPAALNSTIGVAGAFTFYADECPEDNAEDGQFDIACA
jgi:hypothetical protein